MLLQRLHERLSHLNGDLLTLSGTQGQIQLDLPACISEDRKQELMKEYDDTGMRIKKIEEEIASVTVIMACMKKARNHGKLESEEEDDVVKKGSGGKKKKIAWMRRMMMMMTKHWSCQSIPRSLRQGTNPDHF